MPEYGAAAPARSSGEHPLAPICTKWIEKIHLALQYKAKRFGSDADDCMAFYNGPYDFMYSAKFNRGIDGNDATNLPDPWFKMTVNKVAEMVQLFGPVLYHRNPVRKVNPRKVPEPPLSLLGDPMQNPQAGLMIQTQLQQVALQRQQDEGRAKLLEYWLNYTPTEQGLKDESRAAIDEALIKGLGVLWTEKYQTPGSPWSCIGSFYDTVDNLVLDFDFETMGDMKWCARRCVHPYWQVEDEYHLPRDSLKSYARYESGRAQAELNVDDRGDYLRATGQSNDLCVYWKIFSRMGVGGRLGGVDPAQREILEQFGQFCYLVVMEGVPYPLNLPAELLEQAGPDNPDVVLQALEWPTPFWADNDWPFTPIQFHKVPRCVWPMSHLKPALGELRFLNWAYSFLATKIRTTCRDFIACKKGAAEEIKEALLSGDDLTLLEITSQHANIAEVVSFLQHPAMNKDIFEVIQAVENNFEKRVGLTELAYAMSKTSMRSASEADLKGDQLRIRPDDMAQTVEEAMTQLARKEALAARWHLTAQDVQPVLGEVGAYWWAQLVQTPDLWEIIKQLEYRIEAGSARKPNKDRDAAQMQSALSVLGPILQQYAAATGDFTSLTNLLGDWAKSIDLDPDRYLLMGPRPGFQPMPQPAPPPGHGPDKKTQQGGGQPPSGGGPGQPPPGRPAIPPGPSPPMPLAA